jgi:hypothetical protein
LLFEILENLILIFVSKGLPIDQKTFLNIQELKNRGLYDKIFWVENTFFQTVVENRTAKYSKLINILSKYFSEDGKPLFWKLHDNEKLIIYSLLDLRSNIISLINSIEGDIYRRARWIQK